MFRYGVSLNVNNEKLEQTLRDIRQAADILHRCYFALGEILEVNIPAAMDDGDGITDESPAETAREAELHDNAPTDQPKS